jgi:hypothetical protein
VRRISTSRSRTCARRFPARRIKRKERSS